jgi:two-component system chemotaxis sensor kinase CheA
LFTARGDVLRARGSLSQQLLAKKTGITAPEVLRLEDRIAVISPVVSLEGPRGTLILELSVARLVAESKAVQRKVLLAGVLALVLGAIGASLIARSLSRRLRAVASVAEAVAAGDLDQKPADVGTSGDEIGAMAAAFNTMLDQIRALFGQIRKSAQEEQQRLEGLVSERTRELDTRNADMRRVLDNVGQGFFTLDAAAHMSRERSAVLAEWLGPSADTETFVDLLKRVAPASGVWFGMAWESLFEGMMPLEVTLDQLPKRLTVNGRELSLGYRPIMSASDELERVLVVISDITAELSRARAENDEREVTRLFARVFSDRAGFLEFFAEAQDQVESIVGNTFGNDVDGLKRAMHTLKGNVSLHGIDTVAKLCHELEEEYKETGALSQPHLDQLHQRWLDLATKVRGLLGDSDVKIEIDDDEYDNILEAIQSGNSRHEITEMIQAWRLEPTQKRLSRIAEQASALAVRLGKSPIDVRVEANRIRLKPEEWTDFWTASVHLIRNSIDHGLESPEERIALGKPEEGVITLRTLLDDEYFSVEFQDNGRGIDWDSVAAKASAQKLPSKTRADLVNALFMSGFSTRTEATEISGRGIGLAAVRDACNKLGGSVEVLSTRGLGTTFKFVWPAHVLRERPKNGAAEKMPLSMSVGLRWASLPPSAA